MSVLNGDFIAAIFLTQVVASVTNFYILKYLNNGSQFVAKFKKKYGDIANEVKEIKPKDN